MPPPPPPSKSYNLVIVDSSDEEWNHSSEDETPKTPELAAEDTSKTKRRKRKKKKKKKKQRNLHFGTVTLLEFERCLGPDVVPGDGGWPLGLAMEPIGEATTVPIDEYELSKQERLQQRAEMIEGGVPALETRQWDYKHKIKNPLFTLLSEKDRMKILLEDSGTEVTLPAAETSSSPSKRKTRARSGSISSDLYNETYTQADVHHVRNELEELRVQRSMQGATGCTCRKLHVYIPPPNAGKKAAHRRMNVQDVTKELRKRKLLPEEQMTRDELERILHDAVQQEPCCSDDCPCQQNGIECQVDTCSCWHANHQSDKGKNCDEEPTAEQIRVRCGNRYGMSVVEMEVIDAFRKAYVCQPVSTGPLE